MKFSFSSLFKTAGLHSSPSSEKTLILVYGKYYIWLPQECDRELPTCTSWTPMCIILSNRINKFLVVTLRWSKLNYSCNHFWIIENKIKMLLWYLFLPRPFVFSKQLDITIVVECTRMYTKSVFLGKGNCTLCNVKTLQLNIEWVKS